MSNPMPKQIVAEAIPVESKAFSDFCREESLKRIKSHAKIDNIWVADTENAERPEDYSQWLSLVFVASKAVKIAFKTYYNIEEVKFLVQQAYGSTEKIDNSRIADFIKEYCNLCAGGIKKALEVEGNESFISLPIVTRGQDDMFFKADEAIHRFNESWALLCPNAGLICSVVVEIFDKSQIQRILLPAFGGDSGQGDVEFF